MSVTSRRKKLVTLASQKRNDRALLEANKRLQVLQQLTEAVHSTLDLEDVFRRITDGAVSSLDYTTAFIMALDDKKKCFQMKAISAKSQLLPHIEKTLGFSLSRLSFPADPELNATMRTLGEGRAVVGKTLAEIAYPILSREVCSALQELGGGQNFIVVPLLTKGGVVGGIFVASPRGEVPEEEITMLQNFAWAASQAIRNANLYTKTKQAREKHQAIIQAALGGFWANNLEGRFLEVNDSYCQMTGYTREELLKMSIPDIEAVESPEETAQHIKKIIKRGFDRFETRHKRKDGQIIDVEVSVTYLDVEKGQMFVFVRDITERKKAEKALRENEENLRTYLEKAPDGVYLNDLKGNFLYGNKKAEEILGYKREELIGKSFLDLNILPAKYLTKASQLLTLNAAGSPTGPDEFELTRKDGSLLWVEISTAPIKQGGEIVVLGFVRDITERKKAEAALKESEQLYAALASSSPTGVYIVENYKFVFTNLAFQRATEFTEDELLTMNPLSIIHPEDRDSVRQNARQMLKGQRYEPYEFRFITKSGQIRWALERVAPITYRGRPATLGNTINITESKQAQEALRQSEGKYSTLIERSTDGILIIRDSSVEFANSRLMEMVSYSTDEVLGKPFLEFVAPEYTGMVAERYAKRTAGETVPNNYELEILAKDGRKIPVDINANRIEYKGGFADMVIIRDITERKRAEEALKESRKRFQDMVNLLPLIVWEVDTKRHVTFLNRQGILSYGYAADDIKGPFDSTLAMIPEDRDRMKENFRRVLNGEELGGVEYTALRKDGSTFPVITYAAPIIQENKTVGLRGATVDITERKQAEELYATLASSAPVGIYIGVDNKYVYTNAALQKATGYTEEELLNIDPFSLIHPEDKWSVIADGIEMLKGKRSQPYEYRFITKSGEIRWALGRTASVTYQGRQATLGISIDITESKQAQQLYRTLADSSPVGVYILQDGKFIFANPAFLEATGFAAEELLDKEAPWIVHPEDRYGVMIKAREMVKGKRTQPYEFRYITKSGETRWALERTASITYQGRRASLGNFLDITESKQAQGRIEHAAEEWRTTFDSITDFISIHDRDNRIIRMNKAMANALKTTPKAAIGRDCGEVMHGTKEPPANCPQRQALNTGQPATIEMFEPTLGIHFQESVSPIFDAKGEVSGSVHIVRDVTQQKRMEEQLVMTDRLASIGELASGIAHELNNPLTSVIGFSQLLMENDIPDNIKEDLGTVYSEAQRAAAIVKNLLTFARKHAPVKQLSQVNIIIEDVLRLRAYEHKVNNIEVDKRLATNLPEIMVDHFQMQQVFLNIIVNAEAAMLEAHGKGKLVITTERVNSVIKVTFADDGPGIPKENMKRIFSPFFTTKEVGKGTGLGLSICHGIVSEHGGRIYAESEFGHGATFVVELPLNGH
jgi:PAS domain S-box-containing protein